MQAESCSRVYNLIDTFLLKSYLYHTEKTHSNPFDFYLDWAHRNSSLVVAHFVDTYAVSLGRTLVDCQVVVGMRQVVVHDKHEGQHLHSPVAHMVALLADSYLVVDILDLE